MKRLKSWDICFANKQKLDRWTENSSKISALILVCRRRMRKQTTTLSTTNILNRKLDSDKVTVPRSSASGWECWAGVSAHRPPSSSPQLRDLTEPGHSRAAGSPHGYLMDGYHIKMIIHSGGGYTASMRRLVAHLLAVLNRCGHVGISVINSLSLHSSITPPWICQPPHHSADESTPLSFDPHLP